MVNREREMEVLEKARQTNVKFIRLQFTDIFGSFKNVAVTVEDLPEAFRRGVPFDASVVQGMTPHRQVDMLLRPDPDTFVVFPWRPREGAVARLICDLDSSDGEPFGSSSRLVLRRALKEAGEMGLVPRVASEAEFFLFLLDDKGKPTTMTHDSAGYCDLTPVDLGENARRDMVLTLLEMGFETASSHHELSPGQHEICLKSTDPLSAADQLQTFKFVVRTIAQRHGLHASFMPKPLMGASGSGLHWQLGLWRDGHNAFCDPGVDGELSQECLSFIAGLLGHARAGCAVTNPLVNSYKRLVPSDVAPTYVAWARESRNAIIRVPAHRGDRTVVEIRHPDPTCNPYLALAVLLRAGLEAIKKEQGPLPPVPENVHQADDRRRAALKVGSLPSSLGEALKELGRDDLVKDTLGEELFSFYYEAKSREWERFLSCVHPWELDEYLLSY